MANTLKKYIIALNELTNRSDSTITAHDPRLKELLNKSERQIDRILEELSDVFDAIVIKANTRPKEYKLLKPIDLFEEAFKKHDDLGWLFELLQEKDPAIFDKLTNKAEIDHDIYQFKNTPFEDLESIESQKTFQHLKTAVKNREYRNLTFNDGKKFNDVKCLKLIFMEGNWYLAYITNENLLKFGRINFIKKVEYSKNISSFQPSSVTKEINFLKTALQNPFTLHGKQTQIATLKALPSIAQYFEKDMKKFLSSQKFIKKESDGSIIFEVSYTQEMEILPFVQKWMPDLIIQEPKELQQNYKNKLERALKNYDTIAS